MQCPKCKNIESRVVDSRSCENGRSVRRRRECDNCKLRFTTFERVAISDLNVVKNDGEFEPFDREKLQRGIFLACGKRPVTREQVEKLILEIEEKFSGKKEIESRAIGEEVMSKLKDLDHIAFIRFASVYRSFRDVEEFKREIAELF